MRLEPVVFPVGSCIAFDVADREYARLLGLPRHRPLDGDLAAPAATARAWYSHHGRPFAAAVRCAVEHVEPDAVVLLGGVRLSSPALAARLRAADSQHLAVVMVTAGPEVDEESARLWATDRPDEAFFLDRLGAAIAERLVGWTSIGICRTVEAENLTALPAVGPGCSNWDLADQAILFALFGELRGPLVMLESGMMRPKNSMLGAVGLTARRLAATPEDACRSCDLTPCTFRRAVFDPARGLGGWPSLTEVVR